MESSNLDQFLVTYAEIERVAGEYCKLHETPHFATDITVCSNYKQFSFNPRPCTSGISMLGGRISLPLESILWDEDKLTNFLKNERYEAERKRLEELKRNTCEYCGNLKIKCMSDLWI